MAVLDIQQIPVLNDNCIYLAHEAETGSTRIYCAHEYTQANARFAVTVDPQNATLKARSEAIDRMRAAGKPTVPSTLGEALATNPFLRADDAGVAAAVGLSGADPVAVFAEMRARKDNF